tara:strand:+ start:268 stop:876 length:609 start_codon:yes stop_codon:yes gene_type:complete
MTIEILAERIQALEKQIAMLTKSGKVKSPKVKGSRMSGYILYSKDARDKVVADLSAKSDEKVKSSEIMKELGARWKALGDDDKETWNTKAKDMKDNIVADNNVVEAAKEEVQQEVKAKKSKKPSKNADSDDEKPKTKRISGYIIFSKAMREEAKATLAENSDEKVKNSDIMTELGKMWKTLDDEEKEAWNEKAKADKVAVAA